MVLCETFERNQENAFISVIIVNISPARRIVDSRGSYCPGPITDLFSAYRQASVGDVIDLLATDPAAESDVKAWAARSGNAIVEVVHEPEYVRITVRIERKGK